MPNIVAAKTAFNAALKEPLNRDLARLIKIPRSLTAQICIDGHWQALGGAPGQQVSELENVGPEFRIRYQDGAIYTTHGPGASKAVWVHGSIGQRYDALGGPDSWLGLPMSDEQEFPEGGRVSVFERGDIYWWPDTGAIELNNVSVQYTGLVCFGETTWDQGSDSDEPYVVFGTITPFGNYATRTQVYGDVDGGESRGDSIELYRGKPYGVTVSCVLMEHDEEDPDKYKAAVAGAVGAASTGITALVGIIPVVGPFIATAVAPALTAVAPTVTDELNQALDMGDDKLGQHTLALTAKQMVLMSVRAPELNERGVIHKLATPLMSGDGASYKVYLGLWPV